ncbi:hypothetical protein DICVIV_05627 [Dictyocaulus viviparus]|uniref:Protein-lysine N-methyltransferase DICVIV_05627 n=1 Tax=Dictyocaulus viviparus TaxID=29172 RepID=A0A0D8XUU3_DICVI|nr:hypothetical protein DICVIV_05627 [Dictyocaulus viviparus]
MAQQQSTVPEPSELGAKSYWDSRYELELKNFEEFGDEGDIWFGRSAEKRSQFQKTFSNMRIVDLSLSLFSVTFRMIGYITSNIEKSANILDLGCGNGSLLRRLSTLGYSKLTGVDYCPAAIELASRLSCRDQESSRSSIVFKVVDILSSDRRVFLGQYEVILDKGTWDAMSLSNERDSRLMCYKATVIETLVCYGKFIIFSCNFTRDELCQMFDDGSSLIFIKEIPSQHSIVFGGNTGVTSTGVVFEKRLQ